MVRFPPCLLALATHPASARSKLQRYIQLLSEFAVVSMETPNSSMAKLPPEVKSNIMKYVNDGDKATRNKWPPIKPLVSPTSMPPREGASPFMRVPTEIRRRIYAFVGVIPEWPKVHPPKCDNGGCVKEKNESSKKPPPARRNTISDLMTLNKKICAEIAEILYEGKLANIQHSPLYAFATCANSVSCAQSASSSFMCMKVSVLKVESNFWMLVGSRCSI